MVTNRKHINEELHKISIDCNNLHKVFNKDEVDKQFNKALDDIVFKHIECFVLERPWCCNPFDDI